jgi:hypothetical protein
MMLEQRVVARCHWIDGKSPCATPEDSKHLGSLLISEVWSSSQLCFKVQGGKSAVRSHVVQVLWADDVIGVLIIMLDGIDSGSGLHVVIRLEISQQMTLSHIDRLIGNIDDTCTYELLSPLLPLYHCCQSEWQLNPLNTGRWREDALLADQAAFTISCLDRAPTSDRRVRRDHPVPRQMDRPAVLLGLDVHRVTPEVDSLVAIKNVIIMMRVRLRIMMRLEKVNPQ